MHDVRNMVCDDENNSEDIDYVRGGRSMKETQSAVTPCGTCRSEDIETPYQEVSMLTEQVIRAPSSKNQDLKILYSKERMMVAGKHLSEETFLPNSLACIPFTSRHRNQIDSHSSIHSFIQFL